MFFHWVFHTLVPKSFLVFEKTKGVRQTLICASGIAKHPHYKKREAHASGVSVRLLILQCFLNFGDFEALINSYAISYIFCFFYFIV